MKKYKLKAIGWIALATILLGGCINFKPVEDNAQFYMLQPTATEQRAHLCQDSAVGVAKVNVPAYLDRHEIAVVCGCNEVTYGTFYRWAEPLNEGITRVIAENLKTLVSLKTVSIFPDRQTHKHDLGVYVATREFIANLDTNQVTLVADWWIKDAKDIDLASGQTRLQLPIMGSASYPDLVYTMSEAVRTLSEEIVDQMAKL